MTIQGKQIPNKIACEAERSVQPTATVCNLPMVQYIPLTLMIINPNVTFHPSNTVFIAKMRNGMGL